MDQHGKTVLALTAGGLQCHDQEIKTRKNKAKLIEVKNDTFQAQQVYKTTLEKIENLIISKISLTIQIEFLKERKTIQIWLPAKRNN